MSMFLFPSGFKEVVNTLDSDSTDDVLSAKMGKELNSLIFQVSDKIKIHTDSTEPPSTDYIWEDTNS